MSDTAKCVLDFAGKLEYRDYDERKLAMALPGGPSAPEAAR